MNFDKEAKSDKKKNWGGGVGGETGTETKTVCQTVSNEVNTKMQPSTQCRACGTINISKYVNIHNFYIELSSKGILPKNLKLNSVCQNQNVKCGKIQKSNHLHTVEHVVQSTFQNMLITF